MSVESLVMLFCVQKCRVSDRLQDRPCKARMYQISLVSIATSMITGSCRI